MRNFICKIFLSSFLGLLCILLFDCEKRQTESDSIIVVPPVMRLEAPTLRKVTPDIGHWNQEMTLLLEGEFFQKGAIVKLNELQASSVDVISSTQIKVLFPTQQTAKMGMATITVENPDQQTVSRVDLFRFVRSFPKFWGTPSTGGGHIVVRLGDVDQDGVLDAITADSVDPAWVSSYLMPSNRKFINAIKKVAATDISWIDPMDHPIFRDMMVGDFNEDGLLDLVLSQGTQGEIRIMWGDGKGTFYKPIWTRISLGIEPTALAVDDINKDGHLDILVTDAQSNKLYVLLGQGKGLMAKALSYDAGRSPIAIKLWDLNQDGFLDAIVANQQSNEISILLGDGQGKFVKEKQISTCEEPQYLEIRDLDADHHPDVITSCSKTPGIQLVFSIDKSSPDKTEFIETPQIPISLVVEDFDGDGYLDIVFGNLKGMYIHWLRNLWKKPGHFASVEPVAAYWYDRHVSLRFLQSADLNGDGFPDIVASNFSGGELSILLSNSDD